MRPELDVLIIGGGLVGAALACALERSGLRLGMVEATRWQSETPPSYDDRGLAMAPASVRILEGIGLWPELAAEACPIRRIHVSERGRFACVRLSAEDAGVTALGQVLVARTLGEALNRRISALADLRLFSPARAVGLNAGGDAGEVILEGPDGQRSVSARLLVVADGGESQCRDLLGIDADRHDYGQTAVVANVTPGRPHEHTAFERFAPQGPLALLPLTEGRCVAVMAVPDSEARAVLDLDDEGFRHCLVERSGARLGGFRQLGRRHGYALRYIRARRLTAPRAVLLGNAAHTLHPNGAQGLNLGLRDVAALAERLWAAARSGADPGAPALLEDYAHSRAADQRRVCAFSHGLTRIFYNDLAPLRCGRGAAMLALELLPPLKRALIRRGMGLQGRQPRLVRGLGP